MKKTILGVITIVMLLTMMLSTSVNAATLSASETTLKKDSIVEVEVKTEEAVKVMEFKLKFDDTKFKYVETVTDLGMVSANQSGDTVTISAMDMSKTATTVTLKFKALEDVESTVFSISDELFSVDGMNESEEVVTNPSVEVKVEEEPETPVDPEQPENPTDPEQPVDPEQPEEPTDPEQPVDPDQPEEPTNPSEPSDDEKEEKPVEPSKPSDDEKEEKPSTDNEDKYYDEDGNEITKLPQAGSLVPSIALGVAILGMATITIYKVVKNK